MILQRLPNLKFRDSSSTPGVSISRTVDEPGAEVSESVELSTNLEPRDIQGPRCQIVSASVEPLANMKLRDIRGQQVSGTSAADPRQIPDPWQIPGITACSRAF